MTTLSGYKDSTGWRTLPVTGLDIAACTFQQDGRTVLDATLFPESISVRHYLVSDKQDPSIALTRSEILEGGKSSLQHALSKIGSATAASETERILRSHLAGILEAYVALEPIEAPLAIGGQYLAFREVRFHDQLRASGGIKNFERETGTIIDTQGLRSILNGEWGVEGAVKRGGLNDLRDFILVVEHKINEAYQAARESGRSAQGSEATSSQT